MEKFEFLAQSNVGIRIKIRQIPCVPIFRQYGEIWFFQPKFAQKWILKIGISKI